MSFISIIIISFIVLFPSFNLAFEDEDWRGVVLPKTDYADIRTSTYTSPVWFMDTLYTFLGPDFLSYYILSFIFRNLLAFTILVFIYTLTKDRLASFLGGLFFSVSFAGLQNTYEVMNMISYISMFVLTIFLITFFKIQEKFSYIYLLPMGIALLLATSIASFRVFPVYAWAFIVDSTRLLLHFEKNKVKPFLIRQTIVLVIFILLYKIGIFAWYSLGAVEGKISEVSRFASDATSFLVSWVSLEFKIITNYLAGLGNIIFPSVIDRSGTISQIFGIALIVSFVIISIYIVKKKSKDFHLLSSFILWTLLFFTLYFLIYTYNGHTESPPLPSTMRYLMPPFIGFVITMAVLVSLTKKTRFKKIIVSSMILLILIHSITTYFFLNELSNQRNGPFMTKIWRQIPQVVPESSLSKEKMNVFYFETDGTARAIYTVNDGFIPHTLAVYKIDTKPSTFDTKELIAFNSLLAPPIITYGELVSYVEKSLSEKEEPDIWGRIFALKVEGEKVLDIKDDVKQRVEASLNQ
ncbi:MAG: hypothetical protein AAB414_02440 [Patescibacteria group bacterium]